MIDKKEEAALLAQNDLEGNPTSRSILNGETEVENEGTATWETGENVVTITVTDGTYPKTETKTYKVTVTKS